MTLKLQTLDALSVFSDTVDCMLEISTEQMRNLFRTVRSPDELDVDTIQQILELYTQQLIDHWTIECHCEHWLTQILDPEQSSQVTHLEAQSRALKSVTEEILRLARHFDDYQLVCATRMENLALRFG